MDCLIIAVFRELFVKSRLVGNALVSVPKEGCWWTGRHSLAAPEGTVIRVGR